MIGPVHSSRDQLNLCSRSFKGRVLVLQTVLTGPFEFCSRRPTYSLFYNLTLFFYLSIYSFIMDNTDTAARQRVFLSLPLLLLPPLIPHSFTPSRWAAACPPRAFIPILGTRTDDLALATTPFLLFLPSLFLPRHLHSPLLYLILPL